MIDTVSKFKYPTNYPKILGLWGNLTDHLHTMAIPTAPST